MKTLIRGLVAVIGLTFAVTAQAALNDFRGTWTNVDANTGGLTRVIVNVTGPTATVHAFGRCHPTDCDWGTVPANTATDTLVVATFHHGFMQAVMVMRQVAGGQMEAQVVSQYLDGSGRPDRTDTYRFRRELAMLPVPLPNPLPNPFPGPVLGGLLPALSAPTLVSPPVGYVAHHFPRTLTLRWDPVPGAARYTVEVDCFHCCQSGQWCSAVGQTWSTTDTTATNHTFSFVGAQPGRWRVRAIRPNGIAGPMSEWREFRFTQ